MEQSQRKQVTKPNDVVIKRIRACIGNKQRVEDTFNEIATKAAIRKFVDGIGDLNPLWRDEEYAKGSRYSCIVAPPSWICSVFMGQAPLEIEGWQNIPAGTSWEYYRPVLIGDKITAEYYYTDIEIRKEGSLIILKNETLYYNQRSELVAKAKCWSMVAESITGRLSESRDTWQSHNWTQDELTTIEQEMLNEKIRSADILHWEDVEVDEELPTLVKGPLGLGDMVAYFIGAAPIHITAHEVTVHYFRKHPLIASRDPETFSPERMGAVHFNRVMARKQGMPTSFYFGQQNQHWQIQMLTNWIGDNGWLKKISTQYRRITRYSDVIKIRGKVVAKYIDEDGDYCIDINTSSINQNGDDVAPGNSTVVLPSGGGIWPLDKRL